MRYVFDLTGEDHLAKHSPYAPSVDGGPGLYLNLDNLGRMVAARLTAAASYAAASMAAAELGLRRAEPHLAADLDDLTLLLSRPDVVATSSAGPAVSFPVQVARVRLSHDQMFSEATVTVDVVGALPVGLRLGNLTASAFPDGLAGEESYARFRELLVSRLTPDRGDCAELVARWRGELPGDCMVLACNAVVRRPDVDEGELLRQLVGNALYTRRVGRVLASATVAGV